MFKEGDTWRWIMILNYHPMSTRASGDGQGHTDLRSMIEPTADEHRGVYDAGEKGDSIRVGDVIPIR
jgi:hypothetical protein